MEFIAHRINTIAELEKVPSQYGVEVDLRDAGGRVVLAHDPFTGGEDFEEYLRAYRHGTLICNIKSERVEPRVRELLAQYNVGKYFFLDSSFPMIHALMKSGERKIAVRFSEFEAIETALALSGRVNWVWADCFTKLTFTKAVVKRLKGAGFKICLVSPELQGRPAEIEEYKNTLMKDGVTPDAVCAKLENIERWEK